MPSKEFWLKFDRDLGEKPDAIDSCNPSRGYGFAEKLGETFSVFFQPKPVLAAAAIIVVINLAVFSMAHRGRFLSHSRLPFQR